MAIDGAFGHLSCRFKQLYVAELEWIGREFLDCVRYHQSTLYYSVLPKRIYGFGFVVNAIFTNVKDIRKA